MRARTACAILAATLIAGGLTVREIGRIFDGAMAGRAGSPAGISVEIPAASPVRQAPHYETLADLLRAQDPAEFDCLAEAVFYEAGIAQPLEKARVAQTVLNRVAAPGFPKTICGVVHQVTRNKAGKIIHCDFSYYCDGKPEPRPYGPNWRESQMVAYAVLNGYVRDLSDGGLYYHDNSIDLAYRLKQARILGRSKNFTFYNVSSWK